MNWPLKWQRATLELKFQSHKLRSLIPCGAKMAGEEFKQVKSPPQMHLMVIEDEAYTSVSGTLMDISMLKASLGTQKMAATSTSWSETTAPFMKATRTSNSDAKDHLTSSEVTGVMVATRHVALILSSLVLMAGAVEAQWLTSSNELPPHAT